MDLGAVAHDEDAQPWVDELLSVAKGKDLALAWLSETLPPSLLSFLLLLLLPVYIVSQPCLAEPWSLCRSRSDWLGRSRSSVDVGAVATRPRRL